MAESPIPTGFVGDGFPREPVVTVSELNRSARMLLERGFAVSWVTGELSNLVRHASGHWYFTLKDAQAQVRCVMFRHRNQLLDWRPENGMQVDVRALVTLYEPRGDFQLGVEAMRRAGLGALFEAFQRLKERLESEGLFDAARKRPLPDFPRCVGVVTSPGAAALRDVLTTLRRRMPSLPVIVYPAQVQGEGAAQQIASALAAAGERRECDVIVLCRGGGSLEDLWAFNEEAVARAIRACPVPVVSGVGHETDFTIADFAADRRAPTPTGAAELASPNREELGARLRGLGERLARAAGRGLEQRMQQVDYLSRRLQHPGTRLERQRSELAHLRERLRGAMARVLADREGRIGQHGLRLRRAAPALTLLEARRTALGDRLRRAGARRLDDAAARLRALGAHLEHLSPQQVLERGYAIVRDSQGAPVRDSTGLEVGQDLGIAFARGSAGVTVRKKD